MEKPIRIAIDGPGGAGKSSAAREVARSLAVDYVDTGAMYRAVAYKMLNNDVSLNSGIDLERMLEETEIDFKNGEILLDGTALGEKIRTAEVTKMASDCSALPAVRRKLVLAQRAMGQRKSLVMDGRDIGTNVFPDAELKIFLTASPEVRARRRFEELAQKGMTDTYEKVLKEINQRDENDCNRQLNPLRKADDALEIDSSHMDLNEVVDIIVTKVRDLSRAADL